MAGIAGLRGTGDWGTSERPTDFRESILFYNPHGTAPIFALTGKAGKKTVNDPQFSWWSEPNTLVRLKVDGSLASGDTTVTVEVADPSATSPDLNWTAATHLKPGDILYVEPTSDNATFAGELLEVDTVLSSTQFTVRRGAGGTTAASIADDIQLTLMGSAYAEGTGAPRAVSRNPILYSNYTQIFKDTYELTGTADATFARTGSAWSNDKKRKMFDHARAIEFAILWGRAAETTGDNGKPKRFMGGLRAFIPASNSYVYSSGVSAGLLLDRLSPMFDFDTEGGDTRIGFAGNAAINVIAKAILAEDNVRVNYNGKINVYGMDFTELIIPRGRILLRSHPLMSRHGILKYSMFALDFSSIKYVALKGRDTKTKDDVQNKDEDVRRGYIQSECSLMVDRGGLTCAYLGGISSVAA